MTAPETPPRGPVSRETRPPTRIAIINQKGGVGKTTTAVSLAHGLALQGKRVLLFDLDPQGNATTALGVEKYTSNPSGYDFLFSSGALPGWTSTQYENLDVYPANVSLIRAEIDLLSLGSDRDFALRNAFGRAHLPHDLVLIDSPPSLGVLTLNILACADHVLVPVQTEYLALEGLTMLLDTVGEIRTSRNPALHLLGCVLTMVDMRTNLCQQVIQEMRGHLGQRVMDTAIPRTVRLSECPSHGRTIFDYDRWGTGARAYESLCREVLQRLDAYDARREGVAS